jgi:hypothetical protein
MIYLIAIFCSPLALLLIGKPFQAIFNFILYLLSLVFWVTIILHSLGFALWAVAFIHAVLSINSHKADRRNRRLIESLSGPR